MSPRVFLAIGVAFAAIILGIATMRSRTPPSTAAAPEPAAEVLGTVPSFRMIDENGESQGTPAWSTTDNETMTGSGPKLIAVVGYTGASAPYTFVLSEP